MLYRKGGDILTSLSWALGAQDISSDGIEDCGIQISPATKHSDKATVLHNAAYMINDLIHEEISRQAAIKRDHLSSFNVDSELLNVNPLLLDFMNSITATIQAPNTRKVE